MACNVARKVKSNRISNDIIWKRSHWLFCIGNWAGFIAIRGYATWTESSARNSSSRFFVFSYCVPILFLPSVIYSFPIILCMNSFRRHRASKRLILTNFSAMFFAPSCRTQDRYALLQNKRATFLLIRLALFSFFSSLGFLCIESAQWRHAETKQWTIAKWGNTEAFCTIAMYTYAMEGDFVHRFWWIEQAMENMKKPHAFHVACQKALPAYGY